MAKFPRRTLLLPFAIGSFGLLPLPTVPEWVTPTTWPVERMVANLGRYIQSNPDDAQGHFALGRVHALAFTLEAKTLGHWGAMEEETGVLLRVLDDASQRSSYGSDDDGPGQAREMLAHAKSGLQSLQRSLDLSPENAAAHLSLGALIEKAAHLAARLDTMAAFRLPQIRIRKDTHDALLQRMQALGSNDAETREQAKAELQERRFFMASLRYLESECVSSNRLRSEGARELLGRFWNEQAIEHYRRAFQIAHPRESQEDRKPLAMTGDGLSAFVSYEAARGWLRLVEQRGPRADERTTLRKLRAACKRFEALPPTNMITPMVLSLDEGARLEDMVAAETAVLFDLDGDGVNEAWPWLRPGAGFLIWDPEGEGRVTSGRQMFGSVSAQLYLDDGYRVLGALDNDGDGRLTGAELVGIALWFDADSDGLSDPGEVRPVLEYGICALATQAVMRVGRSLGNPCGVELADGRVLASYDWVTEPLGERLGER